MISIIVPVYNVEPYLAQCIESILRQTYRNFELILIDDGSTDRSGTICDEFAAQDSRIRVIHQPNGGVSRARNTGIAVAKGVWLCFVDADDFVLPHYLESFSPDEYENYDFIYQGCLHYSGNKCTPGRNASETSYDSIALRNIGELLSLKGPMCKLYKASIIKKYNLMFPLDMPQGEDTVFNYSYFSHILSVRSLSSQKYVHRVDVPCSASRKIHPPEVLLRYIDESMSGTRNLFKHLGTSILSKEVICNHMNNLRALLMRTLIFNYNFQQFSSIIKKIRKSENTLVRVRDARGTKDFLFTLFVNFIPTGLQFSLLRVYFSIVKLRGKGSIFSLHV